MFDNHPITRRTRSRGPRQPRRPRQRVGAGRLRRDDGVAAVWILLSVPVVAIAVGFVLDVGTAVYGWNAAHDQAASAAAPAPSRSTSTCTGAPGPSNSTRPPPPKPRNSFCPRWAPPAP
jgi:Flp pilus assembly protein TadG